MICIIALLSSCATILWHDAVMADGSEGRDQYVPRCKRCRQALARPDQLRTHGLDEDSAGSCRSLFVEPVAWMQEYALGNDEGKLWCPACGARLGSFSWYGKPCNCGAWIVPSFQLLKAKVDIHKIQDRPSDSETSQSGNT